jgi:hypothetical protein
MLANIEEAIAELREGYPSDYEAGYATRRGSIPEIRPRPLRRGGSSLPSHKRAVRRRPPLSPLLAVGPAFSSILSHMEGVVIAVLMLLGGFWRARMSEQLPPERRRTLTAEDQARLRRLQPLFLVLFVVVSVFAWRAMASNSDGVFDTTGS